MIRVNPHLTIPSPSPTSTETAEPTTSAMPSEPTSTAAPTAQPTASPGSTDSTDVELLAQVTQLVDLSVVFLWIAGVVVFLLCIVAVMAVRR